jgi:hypothetical protein
VSEHQQGEGEAWLTGAESVGLLISLLDAGALDNRRYAVVSRLRRLHDSEDFASLPDDLRARIREIIDDSPR